jgi:hypothetical protein
VLKALLFQDRLLQLQIPRRGFFPRRAGSVAAIAEFEELRNCGI